MDGRILNINGLTAWEFNEIRELLLRVMEEGRAIEDAAD